MLPTSKASKRVRADFIILVKDQEVGWGDKASQRHDPVGR